MNRQAHPDHASDRYRPRTRPRGAMRVRVPGACMIAALWLACAPHGAHAQASSAGAASLPAIDGALLAADLRALAHDSMGGRATGSEGSRRARRYIEGAFAALGAGSTGDGWAKPFPIRRQGGPAEGVNLVARIRGTAVPERVIVITAHYDHLGERGGRIFNGADDNASGVAALLALARAFAASPPRHTIVFAALDAEELGLLGARAFVAAPLVPVATIALNINLDMVGRNAAGELWVAGTHHTPALRPFVEEVAATVPVRIRIGHDRPGAGQDDWTGASDHAAFHAAGIAFLYFGVEDHADYHRETDEADGIEPGFQLRAARAIAAFVFAADARLDTLLPAR